MPPNPHHHRHDHHHDYHPCHHAPINCSCCCSGCHSCNSSASPPPPPPPPISIDQLLQYMAADFIKIQPFVKPQQIHSQTTLHIQSLLHALIRRVSAVESSLSQLSSQSPPNKSPPPFSSRRPQDVPPPPSSPLPAPSLRDVAARTIQARFRRFLVRRSQTLRDLKRLASVKSSAASLRSLISGNAGAEPDALLQKGMDLLLRLDSIQSSDPMIRDGKRSISRELTSMLDFVEKVLVRERRLSLQAMEVQEDIPLPLPHARSAKRVSFAEHGGRAEEDKEGFPRDFEEEVFGYGNGTFFPDQDVGFGLSAPLPLQMEPRLGL